jgi:hypothetical protein
MKSKTLKVAVVLIIILISLVIYEYGYLSVKAEIESIKEEQAIKTKTLQKYINIISEKPLLEERFAKLSETRKAYDSRLITGETASVATATLQETVKGIITSRGGTISSERFIKTEDTGKFKIISVSIDAVVPDVRALSEILYSIETHNPYLVVKDIDARIINFRNPKQLNIKLDVSAVTSGG